MTSAPSQPGNTDDVVVTTDVLSALRERIRLSVNAYSGIDSDRVDVRLFSFSERSSYPLYEARVFVDGNDTPQARYIVKFAPVFPENNEGLTEFRHLRLMHERLPADGALRVPRAYDFYEDINALVMERVGGERFSRYLLASASLFATGTTSRRLREFATMCGRWLREFHEATEREPSHPFGDEFLAAIERRLVAFSPLGFPGRIERRVRSVSAALNTFGKGVTVPACGRHGDYGPQNIHVAPGHIYVFDLNYPDPAVAYEDIDYFLVTLETVNPFPHQWFFSRARVAQLSDPFLTGYFGRSPDDRELLMLAGYYLKALLFRCSKQRRNVTRRGAFALSLFDRFRLRGYYARRVAHQCDRIETLLGGIEPR